MPVSPGLVDLQVNGFAGVDFNDPAITPADLDRATDPRVRQFVEGHAGNRLMELRDEQRRADGGSR